MLVAGYGFAWIGHFVYEKNKPATFQYPLYSLMGDFVMLWQILSRKLKF
ncbi:Predicted membrane protein [Fluoribacter dumoffii]|uniref:Predicted membrane protein n=2 Tax=Fluoribacter dumoffii TaxID=463 RepID=A0A377GBX3_9GAMM|nr:Predicted membrane protein [Fluoribacter dumoffii]